MTPSARAERALRNCYCGELPVDPWVGMAKAFIADEIRQAVAEAYEGAAMIAESFDCAHDEECCHRGPRAARAIRALAKKIEGTR